ncbi:hypothetical protein PQX77_003294 [Marasmius sp. AFHP31]|nr:hypothetical protein PQX77_003294 [Marasmius sp. AFHP31]
MPSKTVTAALVEIYYGHGGFPWNLPTWQEHTGVRHGLFPEKDEHLPHKWTRQNSNDVQSFFQLFNQIPTDKEREKFMKNTPHPGKHFMDNWINNNYDAWGFHDVITTSLKKANVHPLQIAINDDRLKPWPNSKDFIPVVREEVAMKLFGPEAFPPGSSVLGSSVRWFPAVFIQRSWARVRVKSSNDAQRLDKLRAKATEAFEEIQSQGNPKKSDILKVIKTVHDWSQVCDNYLVEKYREQRIEMMDALNELLEQIGVDVQREPKTPAAKGKGTSKAKLPSKTKIPLASEDDLAELNAIYNEYFRRPVTDDDDPLPERPNPELIASIKEKGLGVLGMEDEAGMSPEQLSQALGLVDGLPFQWNAVRHRDGLTRWRNPKAFDSDANPSLQLHWHQLAGAHSIFRNCFEKEGTGKSTRGMLIADEVGLGKTALCLLIIAIVNQVIHLRGMGKSPAPVFQGRNYEFKERSHVIILPGTLREQWVHEIETFFLPFSVDILYYDGTKSRNGGFWDKDGPYHSSKHSPQNRIIIATSNAIKQDFQYVYGPVSVKRATPWTLPDTVRNSQGTIYGERFGVMIFDEAHEYRKEGLKHLTALALSKRADLRLVVTGTPLHTSPKDIVSLSRIVGVQRFFTDEVLSEIKSDSNELLKHRKPTDDDSREALRELQLEITLKYRVWLQPNLLRRTADMLGWDGKPLVGIPDYKEVMLRVKLSQREHDIIEKLLEEAMENANAAIENGIPATRFYHDYRMGVLYAKANPNAPNPRFKTLEEWEPVKSTKIDTCVRIIQHYLSHDNIDDPFMTSDIRYPDPPRVETGQNPPQKRKILVYAGFPSRWSILRDILDIYGISYVYIDGSQTLEKRNQMIERFKDPDGPRVMIFSSVGTTGLNLTIANVVILLDQIWSAQDWKQIVGRAHRQPQKDEVKFVNIIAEDTADVIINEMARQKQDMFDVFVNTGPGKALEANLNGRTAYNAEPGLNDPNFLAEGNEDSEVENEGVKKRRSGRKSGATSGGKEKGDVTQKAVKKRKSTGKKPEATKAGTSDVSAMEVDEHSVQATGTTKKTSKVEGKAKGTKRASKTVKSIEIIPDSDDPTFTPAGQPAVSSSHVNAPKVSQPRMAAARPSINTDSSDADMEGLFPPSDDEASGPRRESHMDTSFDFDGKSSRNISAITSLTPLRRAGNTSAIA